jgi:predicted nucleic acid-binding Zn ribbon protein
VTRPPASPSTDVLRARTRTRTRAPRTLAGALGDLTAELAPASVLGSVQTVWARATGPAIAAIASPVAEREGVLTVVCESSVWAHELEMLSSELIGSLNGELGSEAILKLRCRTG